MSSRDPETRRAIEQLTRELAKTQRRVDTLQRGARGPHLAHSSTDGSVAFTDPKTERVKLRIGRQGDGRLGVVATDGDPPPAPSAPIVTSSLAGLRVAWDGSFRDGLARPSDFDRVSVHVSTIDNFEPSAATYVGAITQAGDGGMLPVVPLPYHGHYVRLVGVNTSGVGGPASSTVAGTPHQVDGPDLEAGSIVAGHIAAGAVEADKLEALLVLATQIIAGDPQAARTVMGPAGLRMYNSADELTVHQDSETGDAVFTGRITGSEIAGSRMQIGDDPGGTGVVGQNGDAAYVEMTSAADTQSRMYVDNELAEITAVSHRVNPEAHPHMLTRATEDYVITDYGAGDAGSLSLYATPDHVTLAVIPEPSAHGAPGASNGALYAYRNDDDVPLVSLQSPQVVSGPGEGHRSLLFLEAANGVDRDYARMTYAGQRHRFVTSSTPDNTVPEMGALDISEYHSILSVRHRYIKGSWLGVLPTSTTTGAFVGFNEDEYERIIFRTSESGATRIVINAYGINRNTDSALLNIGFALVDYPGDRARSAEIRASNTSDPARQQCSVVYLDLEPNTAFALVPSWRISSGAWGDTALLSDNGDNSIIVEPLT